MHSPHDPARDDQPPLRRRRAVHAVGVVAAFVAFAAGYIVSDLDGAALAACVTVAAAAGVAATVTYWIGYQRRLGKALYAQGRADGRSMYWRVYSDVLADLGGGGDGEPSGEIPSMPRR